MEGESGSQRTGGWVGWPAVPEMPAQKATSQCFLATSGNFTRKREQDRPSDTAQEKPLKGVDRYLCRDTFVRYPGAEEGEHWELSVHHLPPRYCKQEVLGEGSRVWEDCQHITPMDPFYHVCPPLLSFCVFLLLTACTCNSLWSPALELLELLCLQKQIEASAWRLCPAHPWP